MGWRGRESAHARLGSHSPSPLSPPAAVESVSEPIVYDVKPSRKFVGDLPPSSALPPHDCLALPSLLPTSRTCGRPSGSNSICKLASLGPPQSAKSVIRTPECWQAQRLNERFGSKIGEAQSRKSISLRTKQECNPWPVLRVTHSLGPARRKSARCLTLDPNLLSPKTSWHGCHCARKVTYPPIGTHASS